MAMGVTEMVLEPAVKAMTTVIADSQVGVPGGVDSDHGESVRNGVRAPGGDTELPWGKS